MSEDAHHSTGTTEGGGGGGLLSFRFAAEDLVPPDKDAPPPLDNADVGSLLFQSREGTTVDYVTNARQHGITWYPELEYSVVNAFADTWACLPICRCPRWGCTRSERYCGGLLTLYRISFTRAQWIYMLNVVCALAHWLMFYLCITACGGTTFGTQYSPNCTAEAMEVQIFRYRSNWTSSNASGYELMFLPNELPVRFDLIAAWFHGLSAIFHSFVLVVGPFDRFAFLYWKQLDNAFAWWRWIEYAASAPLMFFALQLLVGIRDQSTLALSWVLMSMTMLCGLATEAWSRPAEREPGSFRQSTGDSVKPTR